MEDTAQIIQTIIIIVISISVIIYVIAEIFYKGTQKQIVVLKKIITEYQGLNSTRSKSTSVQHYIIKCKYINSDKHHTLGCTLDIYNRLKENKKAVVIIKFGHIIKIAK